VINSVDKGQFLGYVVMRVMHRILLPAKLRKHYWICMTLQKMKNTRRLRYKLLNLYRFRVYPSCSFARIKAGKRKTTEDWEIAQAGLSFEHGGILGSAQRNGPIQLASHAGMFIRIFQLTHDSIFADMARASAIGRDAFVDSATSVASYYWNAMSNGRGLILTMRGGRSDGSPTTLWRRQN